MNYKMSTKEIIKLWSLRFSIAKGWHWRLERECGRENANAWLDVFMKDEPTIVFSLNTRKPQTLKP